MAVAFEVTVTGTWSPNDVAPCTYPASAHFPDLLGTTQTENTQFWRSGAQASAGVG